MINILKTLFPDVCLSCKKVGQSICVNCVISLPRTQVNGVLIDTNSTAIFSYKDKIVKDLIWSFKYKNKKDITKIIAPYLFDEVESIISDIMLVNKNTKFLFIPIPIHKNKKSFRGYNQSELLAKETYSRFVDTGLNIEYLDDGLVKVLETETLTKSHDKTERIKIIKDTMAIKDKTGFLDTVVFLFDDVITSGATLNEARSLLKKAGVREVFGIAIAH